MSPLQFVLLSEKFINNGTPSALMSDESFGAALNNKSESFNCYMLQLLFFWFQKHVRNDVDVNEHKRLSNFTLGHKLK